MMIRFSMHRLTLLSLLGLCIYACSPQSKKPLVNPDRVRIDSLEAAMKLAYEKNPGEADRNLAMHLAMAYQKYEAQHPKDSISSFYLFKAGQVIENVFDDKQRAGEIYFSVFKKYPESRWAPYALFMTGNLFHTVKDTAHAVEMLEFFMAKYPDHKLKADAAAMITSLGQVPDSSSRPVKEMPMNPL